MYKVIIADDESMERDAIQYILKKNKLPFVVVGQTDNGTDAIRLVNKLKPDILTVDIKMPETNGFEAISEVINNYGLLVVVISAYDEFSYTKRALDYGAFGYLFKPARPEEIVNIFNQMEKVLKNRGRY